MQTYTIQPQEGKKGRAFSARAVATVVADTLVGAGGNTIRPIWAQFIGSDAEMRPFMTNLRLRRKAEESHSRRGGDASRLEFLRTGGHQITWQRETEGSIATIFHPEIFRLDPGMVDPDGARFVMLVPHWWLASQELPPDDAIAALFAAYVDRRTRCPLVADVAFYRRLWAAALDAKLAVAPAENVAYARGRFAAEGLEDAGIHTAVAFGASHTTLEEFLAEQVSKHFEEGTDQ
jgi:hypothetical protein